MPRSPFSLKSAHLLMWSSPLLLIVLVFTLTATSTPRAPAASSHPPSSTSPDTTLVPNPTTTAKPSTTTTKPSTTTPALVRATTTTSTWSVGNSFSNVTTTTVRSTAPNSSVNALSGELSGTLSPGFDTVDVPLRGPGDWTLSATAPTDQSLTCGADTSPVDGQVVVGTNQSCQLEIASTSGGTSLTWQLTPNT